MTKLAKVRLGNDGPLVGVQGYGCMAIGTGYYGETDLATAQATLERALDLGVTLFDTADVYGKGANEEIIGPFIRAHRDQLTIATKFGIVHRDGKTGIDNRPDYIRASVEGSLKRLGVDVLDLYYMHRRAPEVPLSESIGALSDLVRWGKVRHIGVSELSAEELREAHAVHPIAAIQTEWSLFSREVEADIIPTAAELGVGFVAYSPLGRGQLTGNAQHDAPAASDVRHHMARFKPENRANNDEQIAVIRRIGAEVGASPAQVALSWLYHQAKTLGITAVPIPGTRSPSRVEENVSGAALVLTFEQVAALDALATSVKGDRGRMI